MSDISTELAQLRDHARKQAARLTQTIEHAQRDLTTRSRRAGKRTALERLQVLLRERQLWEQIADEIDTHQHRTTDTAELDLWETTP